MKRRAFCASAIATLGATALPYGRAFAVVTSVAADVDAITGDGRQITLARGDVDAFRASLRGQLLLRDSAGYDDARKIWNGMFDRKPALIARCAGAADVVRSVNFARAHGLLVAVRGGGHSLSGQSVCDNGLMIDLSPMRAVQVDPASRRARVFAGATLGDLDREAQAFGLITTTGTVSHTGAAGLTLGGGFGRLGRRFGMACDNLETVDVVTADGRLLKASTTENADLFWGIRGGGGNFGVVTAFEYRLYPFNGQVLGGRMVFPMEQARDVLRAFADLNREAPDDLWGEAFLAIMPARERVLVLELCHSTEFAEKDLAPYRKLGKPLQDDIGFAPYARFQTQDDERARFGRHYYSKAGFITEIDHELIDIAIEAIEGAPVRASRISLPPLGGTIARVPRESTAVWHRDAPYGLVFQVSSDDGSDNAANIEWVKDRWPAIEAKTIGFYANLNQPGADPARAVYGGNFDRLVTLKNKFDPTNLFRLNANVRPSQA